jgi:hypothetical protein
VIGLFVRQPGDTEEGESSVPIGSLRISEEIQTGQTATEPPVEEVGALTAHDHIDSDLVCSYVSRRTASASCRLWLGRRSRMPSSQGSTKSCRSAWR